MMERWMEFGEALMIVGLVLWKMLGYFLLGLVIAIPVAIISLRWMIKNDPEFRQMMRELLGIHTKKNPRVIKIENYRRTQM